MSSMGRKFMIKRLAMGLSLGDAAKKAGLKTAVIRALEEENLFKFQNRETFTGQAKAYAGVLNLDITEVARDSVNLWLDSSAAKIYIQRQYNRKGLATLFGENRMVAYGIVTGLAVAALSAGGYYYWNSYSETGPQGELSASPVAETVQEAAPAPAEESTSVHKPLENGAAADSGPAIAGEETDAGPDVPPAAEETPVVRAEAAEPKVAAGGADEPVEGIDETVPVEQVTVEDSALFEPVESISTPRAGGGFYLLWSGLLTFCAGLALILFPAILRHRERTYF